MKTSMIPDLAEEPTAPSMIGEETGGDGHQGAVSFCTAEAMRKPDGPMKPPCVRDD